MRLINIGVPRLRIADLRSSLNLWRINPLTTGTFCKKYAFSGHFGAFKAGSRQISFNPVENAFATEQLALLATSIKFYHIVTWASAEIKILDEKVTYVFRLFQASYFQFLKLENLLR